MLNIYTQYVTYIIFTKPNLYQSKKYDLWILRFGVKGKGDGPKEHLATDFTF